MNQFKYVYYIVLTVLFTSCVTMADYNYRRIDQNISDGNYSEVYAELETASSFLYGQHDEVLNYLDKGLVAHYVGDYELSNSNLSQAEKLIQTYYAKSITQNMSSMLINDTVIDYSGDPYEDIYLNIIMALNYLELEKFDDAFVEIRRFENKLKEISVQYQVELEKQKKELKENSSYVPSVEVKFHNSAFARYLSMLLYRTEGDLDSALVDYNKIEQAFSLQPSLYNFPIPSTLEEELSVPESMCRLNFISLTGLAPLKKEILDPFYISKSYYRVALPVMYRRESQVDSVSCKITNLQTNESFSKRMEKIESVENIAVDTYSQKYSIVVARTIRRLFSKLFTSTTLDVLSQYSEGDVASLFQLMSLASKFTSAVSERADVRTSRFFPASVYVGGINLEPGSYNVQVFYKAKNGKILFTSEYTQNVEETKLNLVESFCFN